MQKCFYMNLTKLFRFFQVKSYVMSLWMAKYIFKLVSCYSTNFPSLPLQESCLPSQLSPLYIYKLPS